jgi:antitoxin YefM
MSALAIAAHDLTIDFVKQLWLTHSDQQYVVLPKTDYDRMLKEARNSAYLQKIDRSMQQLREGKVVVKTMEELEAMAL